MCFLAARLGQPPRLALVAAVAGRSNHRPPYAPKAAAQSRAAVAGSGELPRSGPHRHCWGTAPWLLGRSRSAGLRCGRAACWVAVAGGGGCGRRWSQLPWLPQLTNLPRVPSPTWWRPSHSLSASKPAGCLLVLLWFLFGTLGVRGSSYTNSACMLHMCEVGFKTVGDKVQLD